jgi:hypothetical protein
VIDKEDRRRWRLRKNTRNRRKRAPSLSKECWRSWQYPYNESTINDFVFMTTDQDSDLEQISIRDPNQKKRKVTAIST